MRKILLPTMAGTLLFGGCAAGMGGNPMTGILGSILGGAGNQTTSNDQFARAAVDACGQQASQYGGVSIGNVQQSSRDTIRVDGRIDANDGYQRQFTCTFRSDGRIVDFRRG